MDCASCWVTGEGCGHWLKWIRPPFPWNYHFLFLTAGNKGNDRDKFTEHNEIDECNEFDKNVNFDKRDEFDNRNQFDKDGEFDDHNDFVPVFL